MVGDRLAVVGEAWDEEAWGRDARSSRCRGAQPPRRERTTRAQLDRRSPLRPEAPPRVWTRPIDSPFGVGVRGRRGIWFCAFDSESMATAGLMMTRLF